MKNVLRGILVSLLVVLGIDDIRTGAVWLGIGGIALGLALGLVYWAGSKSSEQ